MVETLKMKDAEGKKDTLLGGAIALTVSVIIVKVIGFLYKMPLSHVLGDEGMGYFNSAYSIFTFFYMLCTGGIPRAVSITVTEALAKGKDESARKILGVSLKLYLSIGVIFTLAIMLFSSGFARLIGNSRAAFSLFCIAPSLSFVAASGVLRGYLNGRMRMKEIAFSEVLEGVVKFIFGLAFALLGARAGLPIHVISALTILGVSSGTLVGTVFLWICLKNEKTRYNIEQKTKNTENTVSILKRVLRISIPITLSSMVMGISNIVDLGMIMKRLVSSGVSAEEAISLYGNFTTLAVPMLNLVSALVSPLGASAIPHLTGRFAAGNREEFEKISRVILTLSATVAFPAAAAYFCFSKEILMLLFPRESAVIGAPLLAITSVSVVSLCTLTMVNSILEATLHPRIPVIAMSVGALLKIIFGYILIGSEGIAGAPISTGICYAAALLISVTLAVFYAKIRIPVTVFIAPLVASVASLGGARFLYINISGGIFSVPKFFICASLAILLYLAICRIFMQKDLQYAKDYVKIAKKR